MYCSLILKSVLKLCYKKRDRLMEGKREKHGYWKSEKYPSLFHFLAHRAQALQPNTTKPLFIIFLWQRNRMKERFEGYEVLCFSFQQLDGYIPGQDYPIYSEVPQGLSFSCDQRLPGYYSDPEAQCQVLVLDQFLNTFSSNFYTQQNHGLTFVHTR